MAEVINFQRRATPDDYVPYGRRNWKYKLSFTEYFAPGVLTNDPEQGAIEYNHYLDQLPAINRRNSQYQPAYDALQYCLEKHNPPKPDQIRLAHCLIKIYEGQKVEGDFAHLSPNVATLLVQLQINKRGVKLTLTSQQIEQVKSIYQHKKKRQ